MRFLWNPGDTGEPGRLPGRGAEEVLETAKDRGEASGEVHPGENSIRKGMGATQHPTAHWEAPVVVTVNWLVARRNAGWRGAQGHIM